MDFYTEIKDRLLDCEIYDTVKDYSKERNRVVTYFEAGKLLYEAGRKYGKDVAGEYAKKLIIEVDKKYSKSTLLRMRQLYITFQNEKLAPLVRHLTWSQCLLLIPLNDINKIYYYINQIIKNNLSKRQLDYIIKSNEYERLPEETKNKFISSGDSKVEDFIKNPILIKNSNNYEIISEKMLQRLILEDIPSFLNELGNGFSFISNEYKIKIGDRYNYIDLLLFNIECNCYVVIELKVTELKKEYLGQIQVYMNYVDNNLKKIYQDKTIGIIICKKDNKFIMEYCSDRRIISKEYELV